MRQRFGLLMLVLSVLLLPGVAWAQESASYKLKEHTVNEGDHPDQGVILSSSRFRVKLDAIGDGVRGIALGSASFHLAGGFVGDYPPPGEVHNLTFASGTVLSWDPEGSVGTYSLYRGDSATFSSTFGSCLTGGLMMTTGGDASTPALGSAYVYLVTAKNLVAEEGTKGYQGGGSERPNVAPCP